jgi:hypothetical protein
MNLADLKRLRADLGYIRNDPDSNLTTVQSFHLARATQAVRNEIARQEELLARQTRIVGPRPVERAS